MGIRKLDQLRRECIKAGIDLDVKATDPTVVAELMRIQVAADKCAVDDVEQLAQLCTDMDALTPKLPA